VLFLTLGVTVLDELDEREKDDFGVEGLDIGDPGCVGGGCAVAVVWVAFLRSACEGFLGSAKLM
jgi:hypothetical protein